MRSFRPFSVNNLTYQHYSDDKRANENEGLTIEQASHQLEDVSIDN